MTVKELAAAWTITMLGLLCLDIVDVVYAHIYVMSVTYLNAPHNRIFVKVD
jgi:hypothetical protein